MHIVCFNTLSQHPPHTSASIWLWYICMRTCIKKALSHCIYTHACTLTHVYVHTHTDTHTYKHTYHYVQYIHARTSSILCNTAAIPLGSVLVASCPCVHQPTNYQPADSREGAHGSSSCQAGKNHAQYHHEERFQVGSPEEVTTSEIQAELHYMFEVHNIIQWNLYIPDTLGTINGGVLVSGVVSMHVLQSPLGSCDNAQCPEKSLLHGCPHRGVPL